MCCPATAHAPSPAVGVSAPVLESPRSCGCGMHSCCNETTLHQRLCHLQFAPSYCSVLANTAPLCKVGFIRLPSQMNFPPRRMKALKARSMLVCALGGGVCRPKVAACCHTHTPARAVSNLPPMARARLDGCSPICTCANATRACVVWNTHAPKSTCCNARAFLIAVHASDFPYPAA